MCELVPVIAKKKKKKKKKKKNFFFFFFFFLSLPGERLHPRSFLRCISAAA